MKRTQLILDQGMPVPVDTPATIGVGGRLKPGLKKPPGRTALRSVTGAVVPSFSFRESRQPLRFEDAADDDFAGAAVDWRRKRDSYLHHMARNWQQKFDGLPHDNLHPITLDAAPDHPHGDAHEAFKQFFGAVGKAYQDDAHDPAQHAGWYHVMSPYVLRSGATSNDHHIRQLAHVHGAIGEPTSGLTIHSYSFGTPEQRDSFVHHVLRNHGEKVAVEPLDNGQLHQANVEFQS
jgi:hypothetical protein